MTELEHADDLSLNPLRGESAPRGSPATTANARRVLVSTPYAGNLLLEASRRLSRLRGPGCLNPLRGESAPRGERVAKGVA